ncbi:MAG: WG repeat-containing protein [Crocinitomicaceae bacterium]|nr:WG repeat-containing protein [Crocinitomicaceae bacterium]
MRKLYILLFLSGMLLSGISCTTIEKSFVSLNNHDYYSAFNGFDDGLKRDSSACAYGLSLYYDSPVTENIDSSIKYVLIAENNWDEVSKKNRDKLAQFNFDSLSIKNQKQKLGDAVFLICKDRKSIACYDSLIDYQSWNRNLSAAYRNRDSLVLDAILNEGSLSFALMMLEEYPNSLFRNEIQHTIELFEYQTFVKTFSEDELIRFIEDYPNNVHVGIAEDSIYSIYFSEEGYRGLEKFTKRYSQNRNIEKAWKELYKRYTNNFKPELIVEFDLLYPNYPFKEEINLDSELVDIVFYPFSDSFGTMGYSDTSGKWLIEPEYDDAGFFYDGLAAVEKDGKIGLINKKNEKVSDFVFDDIETDTELYIVSSGDYLGIINRNGDFIFDTVFQEISILAEGYICAQKDSLYAFYDRKGAQVTAEKFDFVLNFKNGLCPVSIAGQRGLLDINLSQVIPCVYEGIYNFSDSLFIVVKRDNYKQLSDRNGAIVNDSLYQEIHQEINGYAICIKGDKIGYLDKQGKRLIENKFDGFVDYDLLGNFSNNRAVAFSNQKFGIINTNGEFVVKPKYDNIRNLGHSFGVSKNGKWALMDSSYSIISKYDHESIELINNEYILFGKNGDFGVMDLKLNVIIDALYSSIYKLGDFLILENDLGNALYDIRGNEILSFDQWTFYNTDMNFLKVIDLDSGSIQKYIDKQTGKVINHP